VRVIKAVEIQEDIKLTSTFAKGEWLCEYSKGVETKPTIGLLFAYPEGKLYIAKEENTGITLQITNPLWWAEAEVVGGINYNILKINVNTWKTFWENFKPQPLSENTEYLLCSSITLIKKISKGSIR